MIYSYAVEENLSGLQIAKYLHKNNAILTEISYFNQVLLALMSSLRMNN